MKHHIFRELLLACILVAMADQARAQFEGVVQSKNITSDETGTLQQFTMTMIIKKDRLRIETSPFGSTPGSVMIYRNDRKVVWMLNEEEKTYFEVLKEDRAQPDRPPSSESMERPVVRKTGRTRKILGYPAEQIIVKRYDEETELWGTKNLGNLSLTISRVVGQEEDGSGWKDELNALGLFPLSASTKIEGKVVEAQEITRIETKSVAPDLFELPAGFKKQAVGEGLDVGPGMKRE